MPGLEIIIATLAIAALLGWVAFAIVLLLGWGGVNYHQIENGHRKRRR